MSAAPLAGNGSVVPRDVAYLVNQYPKVSHTFIRREILALERLGMSVHRFAVRGWDAAAPDPDDASERDKTRYLLRRGAIGLLWPVLRTIAGAPLRFLAALRDAIRLSSHGARPLIYHLAYLAEACLLKRWMDSAGATHLHAHFGTNAAEVALLVRVLGGPPFSFTVHGPEEFDRPLGLRLSEKIERAAFVVAVSSFGRSQLYRWAAPEHWPKIVVVHCGLDAAYAASPDPEMPSAPRLVCVGRLCEQKGQLLLVRAAAAIVARGVPLQLVLAGDGELRSEIERLVRSLRLESHVRITGWIDGAVVRDELRAACALVLPSFAEGLPVVIMEAMALERPVISTFVAGIPELVRDGVDGWLVAAGDVDALADAMTTCLRSTPEARRRMGEAGRSRVLARHDSDVGAARLARWFARAPGSLS